MNNTNAKLVLDRVTKVLQEEGDQEATEFLRRFLRRYGEMCAHNGAKTLARLVRKAQPNVIINVDEHPTFSEEAYADQELTEDEIAEKYFRDEGLLK